jgi:hypothetical protein
MPFLEVFSGSCFLGKTAELARKNRLSSGRLAERSGKLPCGHFAAPEAIRTTTDRSLQALFVRSRAANPPMRAARAVVRASYQGTDLLLSRDGPPAFKGRTSCFPRARSAGPKPQGKLGCCPPLPVESES